MSRNVDLRTAHFLQAAEARELEALRQAVNARVGGEGEALTLYRREYEEAVAVPAGAVPIADMVEAAAEADLVLVGDYHTLATAQEVALALARVLRRRRGGLVLALEMVRGEHQNVLDAYTAGGVSDAALRNLIQYDARWPFPWSSYGPLLAFGREPGVRLQALDSRGSLTARDRVAARRLSASRAQRPDVLHVALVGDLHLAASHLPARLREERPSDRIVVVHQNVPSVHAQLASLGSRSRAAAADLGSDQYCLITTTPLMRERSYLAWLDGAGDGEAGDPAEEVGRIANRLTALLDRPSLAAGVIGLEVVVRGAAGFLRDLEARGMPFGKLVGIRRQIMERGIAVAGPAGPVYVGQPDAAHFAAAAAALVQARAGELPPGPDRADRRWREADLLAAVRREAFAVLAWRLVEPLAGVLPEPFAVAFDPAAGPPPVGSQLRVERRARLLRARIAADLAGRRSFALPSGLVGEPALIRAAVARAAGAYYGDGLRDALLDGRARPSAAVSLLAPPPPRGRPRERRALLALAALLRPRPA
jgi:hypothetical protein